MEGERDSREERKVWGVKIEEGKLQRVKNVFERWITMEGEGREEGQDG